MYITSAEKMFLIVIVIVYMFCDTNVYWNKITVLFIRLNLID